MQIRNVIAAFAAFSCLAGASAFAQGTTTGAKPKTPPTTTSAAKKKMPARDPKTGRYMKTTPHTPAMSGKKGGSTSTTKSTKKMPARDPKTGRFIKSDKK